VAWTDRRTLWHHRAVKIRTQIIAAIIGITNILSQRYRYMAHHYSLVIRQAIRQSTQGSVLRTGSRSTADSDPQFFSMDSTVCASKPHNAYKYAKLWQNVPPRNRPCNCRPVRCAQVQCLYLAWTHFSTDPTLAEFAGLGI